jgi:hypothetical protein
MPNNNITEVQILRGTSASNAAYVGLPGVLTADLESSAVAGRGIVRLHDGETAGGYIIGGEGGGGGGGDTYTNATAVPTTLGGIVAGSTFSAVPLTEMFDKLLYPYQTPAFTAFSITGQSTTLEVGATISAGSKEFTWTTSNSSNITANTITLTDLTNSTTIASGLSITSPTNQSIVAVTKTSATSHVYRISATNTQTTVFTRDFTVNWRWRMYWGTSASTSLTESAIEALTDSSLVTNSSGTFNFAAGNYKYIAYPTVFGLKTTFKDVSTGFDVDMQTASTVSVTNTNGVTTNYYVHRTTNVLGGAITITVS